MHLVHPPSCSVFNVHLKGRKTKVPYPDSTLINSRNLDTLLNLSGTQFIHLENGDNIDSLTHAFSPALNNTYWVLTTCQVLC